MKFFVFALVGAVLIQTVTVTAFQKCNDCHDSSSCDDGHITHSDKHWIKKGTDNTWWNSDSCSDSSSDSCSSDSCSSDSCSSDSCSSDSCSSDSCSSDSCSSDSCSSDSCSSDSCSSDSCSDSSSDCSDSSSDCCDGESDCGKWSGHHGRWNSHCKRVEHAKVVRTSPCDTHQKIFLHRQRPVLVRPPPSLIRIQHPAVLVKQPPVILHHQSHNPVLVKPIHIKNSEVHPRPVHFKISQSNQHVDTKCCPPKVHVNHGCGC